MNPTSPNDDYSYFIITMINELQQKSDLMRDSTYKDFSITNASPAQLFIELEQNIDSTVYTITNAISSDQQERETTINDIDIALINRDIDL